MMHEERKRSATRFSKKRGLSKQKAGEMLKHGEVRGHPLSMKQRGMFGAVKGGQTLKRR